MSWYFKCAFCHKEGQYERTSCDCQENEDTRIMTLMMRAVVVDTFISYNCETNEIYTHITKNGADYYICYTPGGEYGIAGYSEILQFEFKDEKLSAERDKEERLAHRVLEAEVQELAEDFYICTNGGSGNRISAMYHGYEFRGRYRNGPSSGDDAHSMRVCLMIYKDGVECTHEVLIHANVPRFDIDDCYVYYLIPVLKWMKSMSSTCEETKTKTAMLVDLFMKNEAAKRLKARDNE